MNLKEPVRYILKRFMNKKELHFQNTTVSKAIEDASASRLAN